MIQATQHSEEAGSASGTLREIFFNEKWLTGDVVGSGDIDQLETWFV